MCGVCAISFIAYINVTRKVFRVSQSWPWVMQKLWAPKVLTDLGLLLMRARSQTLPCQQGMSINFATAKLPNYAAQRKRTTAQDVCRPQSAPGSIAVTGQDMLDSTLRQAAAAAQLRLYSRSIRLEMYCASDLFHGLSR